MPQPITQPDPVTHRAWVRITAEAEVEVQVAEGEDPATVAKEIFHHHSLDWEAIEYEDVTNEHD